MSEEGLILQNNRKQERRAGMKQERPSFRVYRAHIYRQYFGRSLSVKPITGKHGECYAILKSAPYKLFWIIFTPLIFILTILQGFHFGVIPLLAALGLYLIVSTARYFFASFVKLEDTEFIEDTALISYEMCSDVSKEVRPPFSAYLKYIFVPTRNRYMHLIEDADGREYYQIPRDYYYNRDFPKSFFFYALGYSTFQIGAVMGTGFIISACLIIGALILLLSPLSLYFLRFIRTDNQEEDNQETDDQDYTSLYDNGSSYKKASGIYIAAGLAVFILGLMFIFIDSYKSEEIRIAQPQTIVQAYDNAAGYASERFEETDIIGFYIRYNNINAMQASEPSYWHIEFQDTPGLMPRPNGTMELFGDTSKDAGVSYRTYQTISPTYDAGLVTDPSEILDILRSKTEISPECSIIITTTDYSVFTIHDPEECLVGIYAGEQVIREYIVNIRDKTARLV
jgi:hypothetical protein